MQIDNGMLILFSVGCIMPINLDAAEVYAFINAMPKEQFFNFAKVYLKLTVVDIENAECRYPKSITEQKYDMIDQWHTRTARGGNMQQLKDMYDQFCKSKNEQTAQDSSVPIAATQSVSSSQPRQRHPSGDWATGSTSPSSTSNRPSQPETSSTQRYNRKNSLCDDSDANAYAAANNVQNTQPSNVYQMQPESTVVEEQSLEEVDSDHKSTSSLESSSSSYTGHETSASKVEAQNKATSYEDLPTGINQMMGYIELCNNVPSAIEVDSCTTKKALELNKDKEFYPILDKSYKGYVLIFNNEFKKHPDHAERRGSKVDVKNLKKLWKEIGGCKVIEKNNLSARKMKEEFRRFVTSKDRKDCGFVAFFIMSHGKCDYYMKDGKCRKGEGFFLGNDGKEVMIDDILKMLENRYPETTLQEIPKLIFFQTCRGVQLNKGIGNRATSSSVETECASQNPGNITVDGGMSETGEVLQGYATQAGYQAIRDVNEGSWYINAIVNVFRQNAKTHHVVELLTKVNKAVSDMSADLDNGDPCKEQSEMTSALGRFLHFFPGQENEDF